jgi:hypothetical protein
MTDERVNLAQVPLELGKLTGATPPSYRRVYNAAIDGRLPGAEHVNGRWGVRRSRLPEVAEALGLTVPKAA